MNNIAITPNIFMYGLQLQNIKRGAIKKIDINELSININKEDKSNKKNKDDTDTIVSK
jgi:hypothetical protein